MKEAWDVNPMSTVLITGCSSGFGLETAKLFLRGLDYPDYKPLMEGMVAGFRDDSGPVTHATDVAAAVWRAATSPSAPQWTRCEDAVQWLAQAH